MLFVGIKYYSQNQVITCGNKLALKWHLRASVNMESLIASEVWTTAHLNIQSVLYILTAKHRYVLGHQKLHVCTIFYMFALLLYSSLLVSHNNKTQEFRHAQNFTSKISSMLVIFILSLTTRVLWPTYLRAELSVFSETVNRVWWPHLFLLKGPPLIVDMDDPLNTCPICDIKNLRLLYTVCCQCCRRHVPKTVLLSVMNNSYLSKILIIGIVDCVIKKSSLSIRSRQTHIWGDIKEFYDKHTWVWGSIPRPKLKNCRSIWNEWRRTYFWISE